MKNKKYTAILSTLGALESIFILTIPYLTSAIVDKALLGRDSKDFKSVIPYAICLGAIAFMCILVKTLSYLLYSRFSLKMEEAYKDESFKRLSQKGFQDLSKYHSAEIEMLYTNDTSNIISKCLSTIPNFIRITVKLVLAIALVIYLDTSRFFIIVLLVLGVFGACAAKLYSHYMRPIHKEVLENSGKSNSFIVESTNQMKIIQAYQANEYANQYYDSLLKKEISSKRKRNALLYGSNAGLYAFSCILYIGPIIYGAFGIVNSWFTYGVMIALIQLVSQIENPLLQFSPLLNQYNLSKTSEERIKKAFALPDLEKGQRITDFDSIVFRDVSFSYNEDHKVLSHFSCEIKKGETVLLSGPSGIGKTTLFMLMMGFISPNEGTIELHSNGNITKLDSGSISLFSYVPQENILFSGSIYDNLRILTGKTEEEMKNALRVSNVYDEIMALPNGIHTVLKDRGAGLSLGQIQRILIAAAILHDAPILLLDEFSSALDSKNEDQIIENLKSMNKTIVYITHRSKKMDNQRTIALEDINNK